MDIRDVVNMPVHENPTLNLPWAIADRPQLFGSCGNDAFGIGLEMTEPLRALHLINGTHPRAFARLAESAMEFLLRIPPPFFSGTALCVAFSSHRTYGLLAARTLSHWASDASRGQEFARQQICGNHLRDSHRRCRRRSLLAKAVRTRMAQLTHRATQRT